MNASPPAPLPATTAAPEPTGPANTSASACCAPSQQATCCAPAAKPTCCAPAPAVAAPSLCGCR